MTRAEAEERARALGHEPYGWYAVGTGCWVYFCRYDGPWHELHDCYEGRLYYRDAVDGESCPARDRETRDPQSRVVSLCALPVGHAGMCEA